MEGQLAKWFFQGIHILGMTMLTGFQPFLTASSQATRPGISLLLLI